MDGTAVECLTQGGVGAQLYFSGSLPTNVGKRVCCCASSFFCTLPQELLCFVRWMLIPFVCMCSVGEGCHVAAGH